MLQEQCLLLCGGNYFVSVHEELIREAVSFLDLPERRDGLVPSKSSEDILKRSLG